MMCQLKMVMKPGQKSNWQRLFLGLAPFLKAFQHHKANQADHGNKCENYQDLKREGYKADKGDQLLEERNDQSDNN